MHNNFNDPHLVVFFIAVLLLAFVAFSWVVETFFDEDGNSTWI